MSGYIIQAERDSVCMGDDASAPNGYSFRVYADVPLIEVLDRLAKRHYLASVGGKNHSWEATINDKTVAIIKGNNQFPESSDLLTNNISQYATHSILNIYFKYHSAKD